MHFQRNGCTLHYANATIHILNEKLHGRAILRNGDVN